MENIFTASRLIIRHERHLCGLPDSCPDYGHHIFQFKVGDQSTFIREKDIKDMIKALEGCLNAEI